MKILEALSFGLVVLSVILSGVDSIKIAPPNPPQHPCHSIRCAPGHSCTLTRRPCLPFMRCGEVPSCIPTSNIQRRKDDPSSFQAYWHSKQSKTNVHTASNSAVSSIDRPEKNIKVLVKGLSTPTIVQKPFVEKSGMKPINPTTVLIDREQARQDPLVFLSTKELIAKKMDSDRDVDQNMKQDRILSLFHTLRHAKPFFRVLGPGLKQKLGTRRTDIDPEFMTSEGLKQPQPNIQDEYGTLARKQETILDISQNKVVLKYDGFEPKEKEKTKEKVKKALLNVGSGAPHSLQEYLDNKYSKYPKRSSPLVLSGQKSKNRLDTFLPFKPNQFNHQPRPNVPKYPGPKVNKYLIKPIKQNIHLNEVAANANVLSSLNFGIPSVPSPGYRQSGLALGAKLSVPSPGSKLSVLAPGAKPSILAPGLSVLSPGAKPSILAPGSRLSVLAPGSKHRTGDKTSLHLGAESREGLDLENRVMSKPDFPLLNMKIIEGELGKIKVANLSHTLREMWMDLKQNQKILQKMPQQEIRQTQQHSDQPKKMTELDHISETPITKSNFFDLNKSSEVVNADENEESKTADEWWKNNEIWPKRVLAVQTNAVGKRNTADKDVDGNVNNSQKRFGLANSNPSGAGNFETVRHEENEQENNVDGKVLEHSLPEIYKMDDTRYVPKKHRISLEEFDDLRKFVDSE
ncbi:uncharacterized protein LOC111705113 isoform X5 [Eurytemora carolleeae]|uniref:uncharacterized protein LOC111705113 isoform X5 n=1 Tax=Eurytemora carolleeae TaxID=1294199 RepID=UPI000C77C057|nr:uncharacterized protein LOC111705113 isoform X5 [Eurytemora carolleeae]|eukprot:XP_023333328.1 uncharacterized protein LOC111705113 isoform X5 [Eurytemora affinis]